MAETGGKKKFKLFDAILSVICVVFVAEAAAPVAAIGNSQYFWWIFLMLTFLLPYGLIASELGTTYDGEGGLYDWVRKAFGRKWGTRVSWYYWINFPLWMASLAVMFPEVLSIIIGRPIGMIPSLMIELAFIWIIVAISFYPVCDSVWILNGAAVIKVLLAVVVGGLGIYGAITHGVANEYAAASLLPSFDIKSLSFISVILFNFLGFEVVCTFADDMENPRKTDSPGYRAGGTGDRCDLYLLRIWNRSSDPHIRGQHQQRSDRQPAAADRKERRNLYLHYGNPVPADTVRQHGFLVAGGEQRGKLCGKERRYAGGICQNQ